MVPATFGARWLGNDQGSARSISPRFTPHLNAVSVVGPLSLPPQSRAPIVRISCVATIALVLVEKQQKVRRDLLRSGE